MSLDLEFHDSFYVHSYMFFVEFKIHEGDIL